MMAMFVNVVYIDGASNANKHAFSWAIVVRKKFPVRSFILFTFETCIEPAVCSFEKELSGLICQVADFCGPSWCIKISWGHAAHCTTQCKHAINIYYMSFTFYLCIIVEYESVLPRLVSSHTSGFHRSSPAVKENQKTLGIACLLNAQGTVRKVW